MDLLYIALLQTPSAALTALAAYCLWRGASDRPVRAMAPPVALYVAGPMLLAAAALGMVHQLLAQGPGMAAGSYMALAALAGVQSAEIFREYVPLGWPWGYRGG